MMFTSAEAFSLVDRVGAGLLGTGLIGTRHQRIHHNNVRATRQERGGAGGVGGTSPAAGLLARRVRWTILAGQTL